MRYGMSTLSVDLAEKELLDFCSLDAAQIPEDRPYIVSNTLSSMDGVIDLNEPNLRGPKPIALGDVDALGAAADWALLNTGWALADAVLLTGPILRQEPKVVCVPSFDWMRERRAARTDRRRLPMQVVLTVSGDLDPAHEIFQQQEAAVLVATTFEGQLRLTERFERHPSAPAMPAIAVLPADSNSRGGGIDLRALCALLRREHGVQILETDTGGNVMMELLRLGLLDESRMTVAGHVVGMFGVASQITRPLLFPSLYAPVWTPESSPLFTYEGVRSAGSHVLFVRGRWTHRIRS